MSKLVWVHEVNKAGTLLTGRSISCYANGDVNRRVAAVSEHSNPNSGELFWNATVVHGGANWTCISNGGQRFTLASDAIQQCVTLLSAVGIYHEEDQ